MRVLVTRAEEDAGSLVEGLRRLGHEPVCVPLVERVLHVDRVAEAAAGGHEGWILTSAAAVAALEGVQVRPRWIAAVGAPTARALERLGHSVDIVPEVFTASDLAVALGDLSGQRVLWPRAAEPSPGSPEALRSTGAILHDVVAYENVEPSGAGEALRRVWPVDLVTALSGSVIRRLAHHLPPPWPGVRLVVIGPRTAAVAAELGLAVHGVASPHTVQGLLNGV